MCVVSVKEDVKPSARFALAKGPVQRVAHLSLFSVVWIIFTTFEKAGLGRTIKRKFEKLGPSGTEQ